MLIKSECVVPDNIHPPPRRDLPYDPHPSGNSNLASYIALNLGAFETPHPPWNFQSLQWGSMDIFWNYTIWYWGSTPHHTRHALPFGLLQLKNLTGQRSSFLFFNSLTH